jgi:hypothetical protein
MTLNAPKQIVFIIAVVLAVLALIGVLIPTVPLLGGYAFWILLIGFIVLAGGVMMRGT